MQKESIHRSDARKRNRLGDFEPAIADFPKNGCQEAHLVASQKIRDHSKEFGSKKRFIFPKFDKDAMYKGMELDKAYTLEELGL